jgi:hypothetical protein
MTKVLIITNEQDLAADLVVLELHRRGVPVLRCNTEMLCRWSITCEPGSSWTIEDHLGRTASSEHTLGVWWRRPEPPVPPVPPTSAEEQDAFTAQWQALLEGLASIPGPHWISSPAAIRTAEDKATQLSLARRLGFRVPKTIWTNDAHVVEALDRTVAKSITAAAWSDGDGPAFVFARLIEKEDLPDHDDLASLPVAFQQPIWPKQDVRVTVVGDCVLAAVAADQPTTDVDWRLNPEREWTPYTLDRQESDRCKRLVAGLGLGFGGIDLVVDDQEDTWFLEINPNGEWAWLSQRAGLPIVEALCDELAEGRSNVD